MNIQTTTIASYGPVAWNRGSSLQAISIKVHQPNLRQHHKVHINPDTRAMAEIRGEFHERHHGSLL